MVNVPLLDELELTLVEASGVRPAIVGATLVHPGAPTPDQAWPATRWAIVAEEEAAAGRRVVVLAEDADDDVAWQVAGLAGLGRRGMLTAPDDLVDLLALIAAADRVLTGDPSIARLAWVAGTPSLVLSEDPAPTPPDGPHVVVSHSRLPGMEVDEVLDALERLPTRRGRRPGH